MNTAAAEEALARHIREIRERTAMTLNLDGRTLAQAVSTQIADLHEFAGGAPSSNAYAGFVGSDNQVAST
jgi:hypothetical protein